MGHWNDLRALVEPNTATYHRPSSPHEALLPDDQISDLELSTTFPTEVSEEEEYEEAEVDGFTLPSLASATTDRQRRGRTPSGKVKPSEWITASTHGLPSPYEAPSYTNHWSSRNAPTNTPSRPHREPKAKEQYASVAPPNPSKSKIWEDEAITVDQTSIPPHPEEWQQDVAERINALTRQIQSHAQFCVDISKQAIALANENKHLVPKATSSISDTLATYVVKPALDLPGKLRTYYPALGEGVLALKEYEENIRRMLACSANARDMVLAQGAVVKGSGSDIKRLKDRLVEQDSMLRDSSSHLTRLIKERDALKKKLEEGQGSPTTALVSDTPLLVGLAEHTGKTANTEGGNLDTGSRRGGTEEIRRDSSALADQLRELRLVVEELSLQQVSRQAMSVEAPQTDTGVSAEHPRFIQLERGSRRYPGRPR